jgi:two-component system, LytTR family, sensor kinase
MKMRPIPLQRNANTYRHLFHGTMAVVFIMPWSILVRRDSHYLLVTQGKHWLLLGLLTIPFYFINTYLLVPFYLSNRKYGTYAVLLIVCIFINTILKDCANSLGLMPGAPIIPNGNYTWPMHVFPLLLLFGMGTSFEMILRWEVQRRREEQIEKEKISTELTLLKNQVNPHFLFNALNTIFSLTEKKSPSAGRAILLLSSIMRYVLYETKRDRVQLLMEVLHIQDYIALQRLRIPDTANIEIRFTYAGDLRRARIEPSLLVMFVENAFKHGISYYHRSSILIDLQLSADTLLFTVSNSKLPYAENRRQFDSHYSGIGLANTQRRLDLIYGKRYTLEIRETTECFHITLQIHLTEAADWTDSLTHTPT